MKYPKRSWSCGGVGRTRCHLAVVVAVGLSLPAALAAADSGTAEPADSGSGFVDYFANWFVRVDKIRAEQPRWAPPLATTSPALQEVLRYDVSQQSLSGGHTLTSLGYGKGLEFIPAENLQFIVGIPAWQTLDSSPRKEG